MRKACREHPTPFISDQGPTHSEIRDVLVVVGQTPHCCLRRKCQLLITSAAADACTTAQATQQTLSSDLFLPADGFRDTALGISVLMKRTMSAAMAPPLPRASLHFRHCPLKF